MTKICIGCKTEKPLVDFTYDVRASDGRLGRCRECERSRMARRRSDLPEETQRYDFLRKLRRHHITLERYEAMVEEQQGMCAIPLCSEPGDIVDHDRLCCPEMYSQCGRCVRGLLCGRHNRGIGQFGDDPEMLRSAAAWLEGTK